MDRGLDQLHKEIWLGSHFIYNFLCLLETFQHQLGGSLHLPSLHPTTFLAIPKSLHIWGLLSYSPPIYCCFIHLV